ncbi:hypothetical protein [Oceanidesulfovibrio marinus]|uniref:Uncharacterized protein n=2 Tax=Oceanidesulfovibrio marinus TaxID=370038 RepID=A0ABX6ND53_9BACT|nr:hypothetical protein [Oceanidesulfovibrio marinus]QJT07495.1 hypothetical protein E8L03_00545 [Oceanidesulfovibrio marinus]
MDNTHCSGYFSTTMKTKIMPFFTVLLVALLVPAIAYAELPRSILGLTLGENVKKYENLLWMNGATKLSDTPFLTEVNIRDTAFPGIRGGSVTYGNCAHPGMLIGLKLKFDDKDPSLFDQLYDLYEKKFGKPDEWQGDAFHTVRSWKWMVTEGDQRINIVLTYSKDPTMRPGVSIKMVMHTTWMEEYDCYNAKIGEKHPPAKPMPASKLNLQDYVPHAP